MCPSNSLWSSLIHMMLTKKGEYRLCGDYLRLNAVTTTDRVHRFIDNVLRGLNCCIYLDDVLLLSESEEQHVKDLEEVFRYLNRFSIILIPEKFLFGQSQLEILGTWFQAKKFLHYLRKLKLCKIIYSPHKTVSELRRFLAILNFYHRFPRNTADDQEPLHDLCKGKLKKDISTIDWLNEANSAFEKCSNSIVQATDLAYSKMEADLSVAVDASDYAISAILQQNHGTVIEPLSFFSKKLTNTEKCTLLTTHARR
ncbi:retrovirus-related Pol polyprotein from transposon opus [Trichonephila inaurata madagascariensis]|uniref:Retrovirus-related Pol polyprotein from transposon opus n=1 Tax=Trichonephila inaurata madagascariensis TaxID=2747483 RepID=A0A8X6JHS9_9ARAC|nr:retrovirus-related Pol polyprotein from transposon opus [Trichonephila inaurata madagascariensis]